ncbi:hypothetical protein MHM84_06015 [Halomonas sp. McH1-25]|uniref:hypothetical protein n=1 Tax=unclassified Halomonas TaxID=2609666 RepID=UPI001EF74EBF|nr:MULTISPECIES: hypothetical protein [unclassified Halomonas]MCG7599334.1 hypothetical protein [Halomonas sp. McH1-25]MCP1343840.1 hypothetical protein [Halomonas sp. FL8]MCP1361115.1 hypothetical protein [Halomonas sp. BBD45]MCP1364847.1 hypothetical protein [Halomonas sp. BBD48]
MREYEPLPYLGDLMFWWLIQPLTTAPEPAMALSSTDKEWPQRRLLLTDLGREMLEGRRNWLDYAPGERWVGGIRIAPRRSNS